MFRTLTARLTAYYVFAAMGLMIALGIALTVAATTIIGRNAQASVAGVQRQIPELVKLYRGQHKSLGTMAPDLVNHFASSGVRLAIIEAPPFPSAPPARIIHGAGAKGDDVSGLYIGFPGAAKEAATAAQAPLPSQGPGFDARMRNIGGKELRDLRERTRSVPLEWFVHVHPERVVVPGGMIVIIPDFAGLTRRFALYWLILVLSAGGVIVLAFALGRAIAQQALRPLLEVTSALERFSEGDFTPRPIVTADRTELGALARAYNGAVDQVNRAFAERDRVETLMRQFIADAGHELRTPLTVIMGFIDVLRRGASNDPALTARIFATMGHESRRMRRLIEKLIVLARLNQIEEETAGVIDVADLARRVVETFVPLDGDGRLRLEARSAAYVMAHEAELHEAIANVIDNALKYAGPEPVHVTVRERGERIEISVVDRGPGLSADDRQHAFDRFYRGESRREVEGSGLGLAIAKRAVERAGGEIVLASELGEGTHITVQLPKVAPNAPPPVPVP